MEMPLYQLGILIEQLPRLEAAHLQQAAQATAVPHMKKEDRKTFLKRLERTARIAGSRPTPTPIIQTGEQDAEKAREWFASRGIKVE